MSVPRITSIADGQTQTVAASVNKPAQDVTADATDTNSGAKSDGAAGQARRELALPVDVAYIDIVIEKEGDGWFAFGIGSTMADADM